MADAILNRFLARGTAAARAAFTPSPPTPAVGPSHGYMWYETDTTLLYAWDGSAWDLVGGAAGAAGDVVGPASSTDLAFARWDGATGKLLQDSTGATLDDAGRATFKSVYIPEFNAGNSGATKTIDWNDGNEQVLTLTDDVALSFDNEQAGGRYVLVLNTGAGGFTPTFPADVLWPDGTTPTFSTDPDKEILITMYRRGTGIYLASINQAYAEST